MELVTSVSSVRILILGQKDGMIFSLYQLAELRRCREMEVLVLTPNENPTVPPSADVAAICEALGYEHRVANSNRILLEAVQSFRPQLLASILWPRRVPSEVLELCPDAINFHPSLLPKHRGSLTQFWAIFEADERAGTTCHRMVLEFDAGKILHKEEVELAPDETALSLSHKIAITTEKCFRHIMELFLSHQLPSGDAWDVAQFPYRFRKLHEDGFIDATWPLETVDRFIRATYFPPYSAARLRLEDGSIHGVVNLQHFAALRNVSTSGAVLGPPFWEAKPTAQQVAQMKQYVRAMAFLTRHAEGHPLRQLWEEKYQEATEYWREKPKGTDVAAEAAGSAAQNSGGAQPEELETLVLRLARAVRRFAEDRRFAPLLAPLAEELCRSELGGVGDEEEARRGLVAALHPSKSVASRASSPRVAGAVPAGNGTAAGPRTAPRRNSAAAPRRSAWRSQRRMECLSMVSLASLVFMVLNHRSGGSFRPADPSLATRVRVEGSQCMDGSPANMYLAPGYGEGRRKWVIYFQGGGWCGNQHLAHLDGYSPQEDVGHPDLCEERARGYHGSSRDDQETRDFSKRGILSGDLTVNPLAHNWNRVMVRNCDGTLFLSDTELPQGAGRPPLQLRGRRNAMSAISQLLLHHALGDASELLLGGCSAGAVAAALLGDAVAQLVRRAARRRGNQQVFVAILSDSGFFLDWGSKRVPQGVLTFPQLKWIFDVGNVAAAVSQECLKDGHSWRCMLLPTALPYVKTPCFVLQSTVDSWQLRDLSGVEALEAALRPALLQTLGALRRHGGAVDGCIHHCEAWHEIFWGETSNRDAFEGWYQKRLQQFRQGQGDFADFDMAGEHWPLLHVGPPGAPQCYAKQTEHLRWHGNLTRNPLLERTLWRTLTAWR